MPQVIVHDFRVTDRILAETDPDAGDAVYLGAIGKTAAPFVIARRLAGPGGIYIDACTIIDADGAALGSWERRFELDGESKPQTITTEVRGATFPGVGTYTLQYAIFDDVVGNFPFTVVQSAGPAEGIVPGPLDAALKKSTIAWLRVKDVDEPVGANAPYLGGRDYPIWYGYEDGRIYVLVGDGEQQIPGITDGRRARLIARSKDKRSQVADVECECDLLDKGDEWDRIARELLVGRRLNIRDGEGVIDRWRETCDIVCLTPVPPPSRVEPAQAEA